MMAGAPSSQHWIALIELKKSKETNYDFIFKAAGQF